jgi:dihydroneopterin aldolase
MDNAQRRYIMAEARETLSRLQREDLARDVNALPHPVETWKTRADARMAARAAASAELAAPSEVDWSAIDERIEAHLSRERKMLCEALGNEVAELLNEERQSTMRAHREELRELKLEVAKLSSECAELRALLAVERSNRTAASADALTRRVN